MKKAITLMILLVLSTSLMAQTTTPKPPTTPVTTPKPAPDETTLKITDTPQTPSATASAQGANDISIWNFLGMLLMLGAVIALIYGFVFFLKRLSGQQTTATGTMQILQIQVLNGNRALYLVDVAGEIILVGTADSGVNLIKEIKEKETIDTIRLAQGTSSGPKKKGFAEVLQGLLGKKNAVETPKVDETIGEGADFLKKQRDRLKNL